MDYGVRLGLFDPSAAAEATRCLFIVKQHQLASELPAIRMEQLARQQEAQQEVARVLASEAATPHFADPVGISSSLYAFKGAANGTDFVAGLMVRGNELTAIQEHGQFEYRLDVSVAVADAATQSVERADTTLNFVTDHALAPEQRIRIILPMRVHPADDAVVHSGAEKWLRC